MLAAISVISIPVSAAWTAGTGNWTDATIQSGASTAIMWNATGAYEWQAPAGVTEVWYLVVAGGGSGGHKYGGGGGAGGLLNGTYTVVPGTVYNVTVGRGGFNVTNSSGQNSSFANTTIGNGLNAKGGGAGGNSSATYGAEAGGSGGGGGNGKTGGANVTGQGFHGSWGAGGSGTGGGGGGAGAQPLNATDDHGAAGGAGKSIAINGSAVFYGGGGGGSGSLSSGAGGVGGGGAGASGTATKGTDGLGGGGGGSQNLNYGASGGNGTVIIRYRTIDLPVASFTASPTSGTAALLVQFTDTSTNESPITSWNWSFGDYSYSDERNPQHVYSTYGVYDVNLTITTAEDTVWHEENDYIVTSTEQGTQSWYSPHQVKFTVMDSKYHDVPDAQINASAIASTFPVGTNWLVDLYGIDPTNANDMLNGTLIMGGTTGSDGGAVFTMLSSIAYTVKVQHPVTMEFQSVNVSPIDSEYSIILTGTVSNNTYLDMGYNTTLNVTEPDVNHVTMHLFYQDMSGNTNLLEFFVIAKVNNTLINYQKTSTIGKNVIWMNYTVPNVKPNQYSWYYNAVRVN